MDDKECKECPEGKILKDGKCVMPEVTFAAFVISLNTSALYHLGEIKDPVTGKTAIDMTLAHHTIDTLKMLQEKTAGNLEKDEAELIENILYDLRLRYVNAKK
ncbi:MAG: DUF1844 domain-containing protein [Desulfobulbaceae bacterium]|nr:DUF1844 domain-containing protein [Desulfobulbaceae bacterium]